VASSYSTEASFVSPVMKPVGKPDARNGPVRFDERGGETGQRYALAPAPLLDSTVVKLLASFCPIRLAERPSGGCGNVYVAASLLTNIQKGFVR
jgi:hypothetical protein